jgi:hypothetical protein
LLWRILLRNPFVEMKYDVEESSLLEAVPPTTRQVLSQSLSRLNTDISIGPGQGLQHMQGNLRQARLQTDNQHRSCLGPVSIRVASITTPSKNTSQVKFPTSKATLLRLPQSQTAWQETKSSLTHIDTSLRHALPTVPNIPA